MGTELESNPNLKHLEDETTESDQTGSDRPESSLSNYSNGRNSRAGKVSAPQPAYKRRNKNSEVTKKDGKAPQRVGKTDEETRHKDKSWLDKRRKDQNKAKVGNHNRKAMSDR